jgi:cytochrome b
MTTEVRVWDPVVRITHWGLATLIAIDLLNEAGANPWHRYFGYAAGALVLARLAWGFVGSAHARLAGIARTAAQLGDYIKRSRAPTDAYTAHNPLGAWMAFTLWGITVVVIGTGCLLQVEAYWGDELLQMLHVNGSYLLAVLVVVHVAGAIVTSTRKRTNLIKAMITGRKTAA